MSGRLMRARAWVVLAALALAGCAPRTAVVSGTITFHDRPVTNGSITLFCDDGQIVTGLITREGTYTIPNVPLGRVKVAVATHPPVPPAFQMKLKLPPTNGAPQLAGAGEVSSGPARAVRIPEKYSDPDRSGWSLDVTSASHTLDLRLTR